MFVLKLSGIQSHLKVYQTLKVESQNFLDLVVVYKPSFWVSFEKLRLGFELLMFYYVKPSSVFLKPSFILRLRFC